ncbi:hypothetical protein, partial [Mycobacterium avium]|uniref:hypothetical protein n=1 Tax=Mycobacterium avium TaxID=1764 RepID=UPI001F1D8032
KAAAGAHTPLTSKLASAGAARRASPGIGAVAPRIPGPGWRPGRRGGGWRQRNFSAPPTGG